MSQDKPVLSADIIKQMREMRPGMLSPDSWRALCDLALSARQGWISVPRDPTKEMIDAGRRADPLSCDVPEEDISMIYGGIYRAMLAAHNDHEPPQGGYGPHINDGPASGSPDTHVRFYIDGCAVYEPGYVQSLQHQLAQRGEWLRETLDKWEGWGKTVRMGADWPDWERIATIRKALGETA